MALQARVASLEEVAEDLREHYKEDTVHGFILQTDNYVTDTVSFGNVDTFGLKNALTSERASRKAAEKGVAGLEVYSALGTVEEIQGKLTAAGEAGAKTDEQIAKIRSDYDAKLLEQTQLNKDAFDKLNQSNHSREITSLLAANKADIVDGAGAQEYFVNVMKGMTAVDELGNTFVKNPDGSRRMSQAVGSVADMTKDELWNIVKADPAHAFALAPSGASGSGSSGSSGGGQPLGGPQSGADWNAMDKSAQRAFYQSNPAEAGRLSSLGAKIVQ